MKRAWLGGPMLSVGTVSAGLGVIGAVVLPRAEQLLTVHTAPNLFVQLLVFAVVGAVVAALADRQRRHRHLESRAFTPRTASASRRAPRRPIFGHTNSDIDFRVTPRPAAARDGSRRSAAGSTTGRGIRRFDGSSTPRDRVTGVRPQG